jgi:hypothetical protein
VESIGSSQELRLEICSNWSVDTIRKLLVLGAQTGPLSPGCRKDDARFLWMEAFRASGGSVLFSSIGEVAEWFDFMVYSSLAPELARVFFAADSRSSLLRGVFGARPILLAGQFPVSRSAASLRGADPK